MRRSLQGRLARALAVFLAALPPAIAITVWIFARYEGRELTWYQALLFLVETVTTTGYGELLPFRSPVTVFFSMALMIVGVIAIFMYMTVLAGDWLASRFQELPPTRAPKKLRGHVIICGYTPLVEALLIELQEHRQRFLVLDPRPDRVLELRRAGVPAVHADPTTAPGLQAGGLDSARALVADLDDSTNATILLQAHHLRDDLPLIGTVEHRGHDQFLRYAGASKVILPKEVIGRRIARWVVSPVPEGLSRIRAGDIPGLGLLHLFIAPHSSLENTTVRTARLRERFGVSIVAVWRRGRAVLAPGPDQPLAAGTVVTVAGAPDALAQIQPLSGVQRRIRFGRTERAGGKREICIIAGFGDVGAGVVRALADTPLDVRVIGLTPPEGGVTYIQGDATDEAVLQQAGVAEAATFVVALNDDTAAIFATLMVRRINPGARIVARANHLQNVASLYMAGADYVLSVPEVAGSSLAQILLGHSDRPAAAAPEATLAKLPVPPALAGRSLAQSGIGRLTGCMVIAVRRGGNLAAGPVPDFELQAGDELVLFGTAAQLASFAGAFGGDVPEATAQ